MFALKSTYFSIQGIKPKMKAVWEKLHFIETKRQNYVLYFL